MIDRLRKRISTGNREGGFTLIELLVVLIIIAVLLAIAIPAYLGFKDRAEKRAAQSNVREAVPTAEAYGEDNNGSYANMDLAALKAIDPATKIDTVVVYGGGTDYCIDDTVGNHTARFRRSTNEVEVDASGGAGCPAS